ncbi:MAG: hypothetical protein SFU85_10325 [Candidatus Methylacidiphilales bacterium]|nr:hypothetical protein [Candidatus Methylacidiphilales bacterium]
MIKRALGFVAGLLEPGWKAFRAYRPVFLGIQSVGLLLLLAYYFLPGLAGACEALVAWKRAGGLWFAALATVVSGGVVPELLKWKMRPAGLPHPGPLELLHQMTLFAILGMMVDVFYDLQGRWFGPTTGLGVLLLKWFVDQFVYSLFLTGPLSILWFMWREHRFDPLATMRAAWSRQFIGRVLPMWATGLVFWTPLLFGLYVLPVGLQFLAFLVANCAWGILMVFIARRQIDGADVG